MVCLSDHPCRSGLLSVCAFTITSGTSIHISYALFLFNAGCCNPVLGWIEGLALSKSIESIKTTIGSVIGLGVILNSGKIALNEWLLSWRFRVETIVLTFLLNTANG